MHLWDNPFHLLQCSLRDNRQKIIDCAEERSLVVDAEACNSAKATLINPRLRLSAELRWLPGVAPGKTTELVDRARQGNKILFSVAPKLPDLAACNLLACTLEAASANAEMDTVVTSAIVTLATRFDAIAPDDVLRLVNEDRSVAGFPPIKDTAAIGQELQGHREYYLGAMTEALKRLKGPDAVLTEIVEQLTEHGEKHAPLLVEELTARYGIEVQRYLDKLAEGAEAVKKKIETDLKNKRGTYAGLSQDMAHYSKLLREWDTLAQPLQVIAKSRGSDESISHDVAMNARGLALHLANEYDLHDEAKQVTDLLSELFEELPQLFDRLLDDSIALDEIIEKKKQSKEEAEEDRREWLRSIDLDVTIGSDRLQINGKGVTYNYRTLPLEAIDRVRWGILIDNSSMFASNKYTVWIGTPNDLVEIECKRFMEKEQVVTQRYEQILKKVWRAVGERLVTETLHKLATGSKLKFPETRSGHILMDRTGVELGRDKLFGWDRVHFKWPELSINAHGGYFIISATKDSKSSATLGYRDSTNAHIVEAVMRFLWKDGNHLKMTNGEF